MNALHFLLFVGYVLLCGYLQVGLIFSVGFLMSNWRDIWDPETLYRDSVEWDMPLSWVTFSTWIGVVMLFFRHLFWWAPLLWDALYGASEDEADEVAS